VLSRLSSNRLKHYIIKLMTVNTIPKGLCKGGMKVDGKIVNIAKAIKTKTIERRRDFHRYAEAAWTEFRTAAIVADTLEQLGYCVLTGDEVIEAEAMMGVPSLEELEHHMKRALAQNGKLSWIEKMKGGKTGVVGVIRFAKPGPVVALRFDMDANDLLEAEDDQHRPYREKFTSVNKGTMHACGHDGHTAIGLAIAEIISMLAEDLAGTIKLIFQPGEEGVRGAKAMVAKGVVDDVDYIIGMHLGTELGKTGKFAYGVDGFLATTKMDASFAGVAAHAGSDPEVGKNALLAAANAIINLHAISRHSQGDSRINVGVMHGGTGRNVIPANALIKFETRGSSTEINEYMQQQAIRVIEAAASMYGVTVSMNLMGSAAGGKSDFQLAERIQKVAKRLEIFTEIVKITSVGGSEDYTYFMERVQRRGGQGIATLVGATLAACHHNSYFDFDEDALELATTVLTSSAVELLTEKLK
jgi:aminobenzoyl-glutamate utilization protein A